MTPSFKVRPACATEMSVMAVRKKAAATVKRPIWGSRSDVLSSPKTSDFLHRYVSRLLDTVGPLVHCNSNFGLPTSEIPLLAHSAHLLLHPAA